MPSGEVQSKQELNLDEFQEKVLSMIIEIIIDAEYYYLGLCGEDKKMED